MSQAASGRVAAIGKIRLFGTPPEFLEYLALLQVLPEQSYSTDPRCLSRFLNQIHHPVGGFSGSEMSEGRV